jgi:hypothetical protein
MSWLYAGDDALHYSDHSHRWIAPPDMEQDRWEAKLRGHLDQHRTSMGGPIDLDDWVAHPRGCRRAA